MPGSKHWTRKGLGMVSERSRTTSLRDSDTDGSKPKSIRLLGRLKTPSIRGRVGRKSWESDIGVVEGPSASAHKCALCVSLYHKFSPGMEKVGSVAGGHLVDQHKFSCPGHRCQR